MKYPVFLVTRIMFVIYWHYFYLFYTYATCTCINILTSHITPFLKLLSNVQKSFCSKDPVYFCKHACKNFTIGTSCYARGTGCYARAYTTLKLTCLTVKWYHLVNHCFLEFESVMRCLKRYWILTRFSWLYNFYM